MNCQWVHENVSLYLYRELADDARFELEQHVRRCGACAQEVHELERLHQQLEAAPQAEVTPNLLAACRLELHERLEKAQPRRWLSLVFFDPVYWLRQMRFSPALAAVIFLVGFGAGVGAMYRTVAQKGAMVQPAGAPQRAEASILGVRSIQRDPANDRITIQYQTTKPEEAQGSLSDPDIQRLLLYAARTNRDSGVRMDSIDLLKQKPDDAQIREGLVFAMRYDNNPGARLKALDAVAPYVRGDIRVRNAILEALLNDNSPGVRIGALNALKPSRADTSVRQALQQLSKDDPNPAIRVESRKILVSTPEID
ncbi:MAG: zf-HC2 domain-containing protein [Candidatus Korobacteraceae bacterium]|jgi:hypothetical protein